MQEGAGEALQDTSLAGCVLFESKLNALLDEVRLPASSDIGNCENGQPMPMAWHLKHSHCQDSKTPTVMSSVTDHSERPESVAAPKIRRSCYWDPACMQLAAMRARDPAAKALIFTQFNTTLNWLSRRLQQEGYGYRTISGSMPLKKRARVRPCYLAFCKATLPIRSS